MWACLDAQRNPDLDVRLRRLGREWEQLIRELFPRRARHIAGGPPGVPRARRRVSRALAANTIDSQAAIDTILALRTWIAKTLGPSWAQRADVLVRLVLELWGDGRGCLDRERLAKLDPEFAGLHDRRREAVLRGTLDGTPQAAKVRLVEKFTPLLYLDVQEPVYPVSPADFAEHCALWSSQPPDHLKNNWGQPAGADRQPLVPRGAIQANVPLPFAAGSRALARLQRLAGRPCRNAHVAQSPLRRAISADLVQPWYSADVWHMDDLLQVLGPSGLAARFGLGPADRPPQLDGIVVISYHFLFPVHRQLRQLTTRPPETDPYSGDYEGDWTTFAVVTRAPNVPADMLTEEDCVAVHAAFGQRWRPIPPDYPEHVHERMLIRPWGSVLKVGDHPVVVAAPGTHNLYPHDEPQKPGRDDHNQVVRRGTAAERAGEQLRARRDRGAVFEGARAEGAGGVRALGADRRGDCRRVRGCGGVRG